MQQVEKWMARYGVERSAGKWRVGCASCGQSQLLGFPPHMDPDAMAAKFRRAGWRVDWGKKPQCGVCANLDAVAQARAAGRAVMIQNGVVEIEEETMARDVKGELKAGANNIVPLTAASSSALIAATPAAGGNENLMFSVWELLHINFDKDKHRYAKGWSDEQVARETGASIEAVGVWREKHFGPLAEPPEMTAVRESLAQLEAQMTEAVRKYTDEAEAHRQLFDEAMRGYRSKLGDLKAQMEKLARPHHPRTAGMG